MHSCVAREALLPLADCSSSVCILSASPSSSHLRRMSSRNSDLLAADMPPPCSACSSNTARSMGQPPKNAFMSCAIASASWSCRLLLVVHPLVLLLDGEQPLSSMPLADRQWPFVIHELQNRAACLAPHGLSSTRCSIFSFKRKRFVNVCTSATTDLEMFASLHAGHGQH